MGCFASGESLHAHKPRILISLDRMQNILQFVVWVALSWDIYLEVTFRSLAPPSPLSSFRSARLLWISFRDVLLPLSISLLVYQVFYFFLWSIELEPKKWEGLLSLRETSITSPQPQPPILTRPCLKLLCSWFLPSILVAGSWTMLREIWDTKELLC